MELTTNTVPGAETPRGRTPFLRRLHAPSLFQLYVAAAIMGGGFSLYVAARSIRVPSMSVHAAVETGILACAVLVAELFPITLRRGETPETYSLSGTAAIALIITGPLWLGALAQVAAGFVDDIRRRRSPVKIAFNLSIYAIGVTSARAVYAYLSGHAVTGFSTTFGPSSIPPALAAAATYFLANVSLVAIVSALAQEMPPFSLLATYMRSEAVTAITLLAVGPVVLIALNFSLLTLPLCIFPVLAVSGGLVAANREVLAMHDPLTGLPNRALLLQRAERVLHEVDDNLAALLFIDLDHFKEVNDAMGHPVGDELLKQIGIRLAELIGPNDFAARLGGDEFAVLSDKLADPEAALKLAARIAAALAGPVTVQGLGLHVEASVGVALCPVHASDVDVLLQRADVALYQAKGRGPGSVALYDSDYDHNSVERLTLMEELRSGLETQLVIHYQPKCRLTDGSLVGVEALVRWQHPTFGLLPPSRFIAAAENTGLMMPMTLQVMRQAMEQWKHWHDDGLHLSMSVNVSARNLNSDLATEVVTLLTRYEMPPKSLLLEVTESEVIRDTAAAAEMITELRSLGVGISIDDFGTGHSSLAYIKELSPTEVKIDQSFVRAATDSPKDSALVRAAIELGRSLGLQVVAEGVETPEILKILADADCDLAQGFFILPPVPGDDLARWSRQPHTWTHFSKSPRSELERVR
ncbi:MAG: putative bifunctional diguanylate cyclase/phosphodiesterase [Acidimicrobiales bacterium]